MTTLLGFFFVELRLLGSIELDHGPSHGVVLSSDEKIAYVATYNNALQIVNISDPTNPELLDRFEIPGNPVYIRRSNDSEIWVYSWIARDNNKLYKVDISDPVNLTIDNGQSVRQEDIPLYNPNLEILAKFDDLNIGGSIRDISQSNDGSLAYVSNGIGLVIVRLK